MPEVTILMRAKSMFGKINFMGDCTKNMQFISNNYSQSSCIICFLHLKISISRAFWPRLLLR